MEPLILEVKSPAPKGLDGLNYADKKLQSMMANLQAINALFEKPVEVRINFRSASAAITALRNRAAEMGNNLKNFKPFQVADLFKFDRARFQDLIADAEKEITRHLSRRQGRSAPKAINPTTGEFADIETAGRAVMLMTRQLAQQQQISLSEFLRKSLQPVATQPVAPVAQTGGPSGSAGVAANPFQPSGGGGGGGQRPPPPPRPPSGGPTNPTGPRPSDRELEFRELVPADASRQLQRVRTYLRNVGEVVRIYAKADQTGGPEEPYKEERVVNKVAPALRELRASMVEAQRRVIDLQADASSTPQAVSAMMRQMAGQLESAAKAIRAQDVGQDDEADKAMIRARRLLRDATRLEAAQKREDAAKTRRMAQDQIASAQAGQAQAIARGDVGARVKLATELEEAIQKQSGTLTPRDVARVRGQIGRLRGSEEAKDFLRKRADALDAIAKADAAAARGAAAGGLDAAEARSRAAEARAALLRNTEMASSLTPRQRFTLQAQEARLRVKAQADMQGAVRRDVVGQLDAQWTAAQTAIASSQRRDGGSAARVRGAEALRAVLERHGNELDELERNRWSRRVAMLEGNAAKATAAYRAQARREAERTGRGRAEIQRAAVSAAERRAASERAMAEYEARRRDITHSTSQAQGLINEELASGGRITRRDTVSKGGKILGTSVTTERETKDGLRRVSVMFTEAGANVREFERALKSTRAELGASGRDFFRNTITVTAWAASVGALYSTLGLLRQGAAAFVSVELATARLGAVYRGSSQDVRGLTDDVLRLAAAEGRSSAEAVDSAIRWARVGYNRGEVLRAVSVSLKAANVAEISAAEATELLTGVTTAYGLRARDLDDVLGMLNQTSNTWNASNAELLQGLTRTASVAKQAQIPLAELIGILGAAIGTTGQSGANIGNAIKSLVTNLAAPELQKRLREGFNFEVMMGEGDIAPAAEILKELFVAYQAFNREQRQSLLYFAAGRTQASRMAAIMDSWVRAQVLAINAQLNLNSAERENIAIRETLHNQLQGLVTEFERFAAMQVASGPLGGVLKDATTTLKNVLKLGSELTRAGGDAGAWASQGMLGLGGVIGARLAMTAVQMRGQGGAAGRGFVGNTLARVGGAGVALVDTLNAATEQFMTGRYGTRRRPGAQTLTGIAVSNIMDAENAMKRMSRRGNLTANLGIRELEKEMSMLARTGVMGSVAWNRSLALVGVTARGVLMTLRGLLVAVRSMLFTVALPLAAMSLAIGAFNAGMEGVGVTIDGVTAKLAKFEQEADAAAAAARAVQQSIRLIDTVERALVGQRDPEARAKMLRDLGDVQLFSEATRNRLTQAAAQGQDKVVMGVLAEERARLRVEGALRRIAELKANRKAQEETQAALNRIKGIESTASGPLRLGSESRLKNIAELEAKIANQRDRGVTLLLQEQDALRERLELTGEFRRAEAFLAASADSARSVFDKLPASGDVSQGANRIAGLETSIQQRQNVLDGLLKAESATSQDISEMDAMRSALEKERNKKLTELELAQFAVDDALSAEKRSAGTGDSQRKIDAQQVLGARMAELEKIDGQIAASANTPSGRIQSVKALQEETRKAIEKDMDELAKARAEQAYALTRDQVDQYSVEARARLSSQDYGSDDGERFLRRQRAAKDMERDAQSRLSRESSGEDRARAAVDLMVSQVELQSMALDRQRLLNDLRRQEHQIVADTRKELERTLLTASPADMVRRVAAARLGQTGIDGSGSQFFSASPQMREELARLFPERFNPEVRGLRRAQGLIAGAPDLSGNLALQQQALQVLKDIVVGVPLRESADAAALQLTALASVARNTAAALASIPQVIATLLNNPAAPRPARSGPPQMGGTNGI